MSNFGLNGFPKLPSFASLGSAISSASGAAGTFQLKAGAAIAQNDAVQLGPDGRAYPVACSDYAAVANCTYGTPQTSVAAGQIVAQTQVVAGQTMAYQRQAVVQGSDGSIYTLTTGNSGGQGLLLSRYSASGGLVGQLVLDSSTVGFYTQQIFILSNGTIATLAFNGSNSTIYYALCDANLLLIKGLTSIGEASNAGSNVFGSIPLSAGGFAIVHHGASALQSRLLTFDNAGLPVLPSTVIWTRTGSNGVQYHKIVQLSNGNLAVAVSSNNTTSSIGFFHGVFTTAGATVLALANLTTYSIASAPELVVLGNFYAVAYSSSSGTLAVSVFDNSGSLQGVAFSAGGASVVGNKYKLLAGNGNFWFIASIGANSTEGIVKIPTTGTGYITYNLSSSTSLYGAYIDAFYENGMVVIVAQPAIAANAAPILWVFSETQLSLVSAVGTSFGVQPGTNSGQYQRVIPGGDFSFICMYEYVTTPVTNLCVGKYANTAVMGVAQSSATVNSTVSVAGVAGAYTANYVKGSPSKQFDHSAANIYGNKGALMNYGAVMKGL